MTRAGFTHTSVSFVVPTDLSDRAGWAAERDGYGHEKSDRQRWYYEVVREAIILSERGHPIVTAEEVQP